jgi:hypothetical protein
MAEIPAARVPSPKTLKAGFFLTVAVSEREALKEPRHWRRG